MSSSGDGTNRASSPTTVTDDIMSKLNDILGQLENLTKKQNDLIDKQDDMSKKQTEEIEANREFRTTTQAQLGSLIKYAHRSFNATLNANPGLLLDLLNVQILQEQRHEGAVAGKSGRGASTWTFFKVLGSGTTPTKFYAASCAHCAFIYKNFSSGNQQFVVVPQVLIEYVSGVCLLKAGHRFGCSYEGAKDQDIVFLELHSSPESVDKERVLIWHERKNELVQTPYFPVVAGENVKSPILGRNAIVDDTSQCWFFMLDSQTEPGQSGTVILGIKKEDMESLALDDFENNKSSCIVPLGVYTGIKTVDEVLRPRGRICPLPPHSAFERKGLKSVGFRKIELGKYEKHPEYKYTENEKWNSDALGCKLQSEGENSKTMFGVFIDAPSVDSKNKNRVQTQLRVIRTRADAVEKKANERKKNERKTTKELSNLILARPAKKTPSSVLARLAKPTPQPAARVPFCEPALCHMKFSNTILDM